MSDVRARIETVLRNAGLTDEPETYDGSIHSWRCEYPETYGRCTCFHDLVDDLSEIIDHDKD